MVSSWPITPGNSILHTELIATCGRVGHFAKVCQKSMVNTVATDNPTTEPTVDTLHVSSTVNMSNTKHSQHSLEVTVIGKRVTMLIDSGSDITKLHIKAVKRLNLPFKKPPVHPQILGATNIPITIVGIFQMPALKHYRGSWLTIF